ncbi:MAG TPA: DNA-processing protein DprA [Urbifossiella sp.]|nr:DNA-processing protein DprA [Urbifossiella sp.]
MPPVPDAVRDHLALRLVPGLGPKLTAALLDRFGSASAARQATAAQLRTIPHIGDKTATEMAAALRSVDIGRELELIESFGVTPIPLGFPGYPPPLLPLAAAPQLLYFRGSWTDADVNAVGIVSSRSCTGYGKKVAAEIARGLARAGVTVVSGLARGIDGAAHRGALEAGGRTIAVLAGGLSSIYPPEHTELADEVAAAGALLTETPMTVAPQPGMFPARNRIISGLSRGVVVVEANFKSGALITVDHALEQGKEVFAVPGPTDSPASAGCLEIIRKGARLVRNAADILEDLEGIATPDWKPRAAAQPTLFAEAPPPPTPTILEPAQKAVWDQLGSKRHADELARDTGFGAGELAKALMQLELKRLVRRMPGNYYERR